MLTHARLLKILRYDPATGRCYWRVKTARKTNPGKQAGRTYRSARYDAIQIDGVRYYAHKLVWFYMTGKWPRHEVDHRDLDEWNNRWRNLRKATSSQNKMNRRSYKNKSGRVGVYYDKARGKWSARLQLEGRTIHFGRFETFEWACAARMAGERKYFGEFARVV